MRFPLPVLSFEFQAHPRIVEVHADVRPVELTLHEGPNESLTLPVDQETLAVGERVGLRGHLEEFTLVSKVLLCEVVVRVFEGAIGVYLI